ncbi:MAG: mechanosensitive ion channel family protein [Deltaproteobacteria bacterium]|nr:mechanosensitive ion channel family protein [Deltaproteobacteria bacterium]
MHFKYHHRLFVGALLFILLLFTSFSAVAKGPSSDDIEDVLGIMESPTKREAFTKNLKNLLEAKRVMEKKKTKKATNGDRLFIFRLILDQIDAISQDVRKETIALGLMVDELPETFSRMKTFFLETKNRPHLRILFLDVAAALLAMLIFSFFLRYPIRSATDRMKTVLTKIGWGGLYILLKTVPFVALFIVFEAMFRAFPSFPKGRTLVLLLFTLLSLYQLIMAVFHVLLSPDETHARLTPISDENANYLWIWMRRFALYAFFYFMVTRSFLWTQESPLYFSYLRGLLLIPFPLMFTVFVFQLAREIRMKHGKFFMPDDQSSETEAEAKTPEGKSRVITTLIRCWPILATGYIWAIFLSFIVKYEKGFEYLFRATLGTVLTVVLLLVLFYALDLTFMRFFQIKDQTRRRFPGLEQKANRYLLIVKKGVKIAILIVSLGVIGQIWGIPVSTFLTSDMGATISLRGLAIIFTVFIIAFLIEINNTVAGYLLKEKRRGRKIAVSQKQKTLIPVIQTAINIAAGFVGGIIVLERLGVNTTPILAGAGIVGLAVGFGSQTLVKDIISGLFVLFEESIRVGDWAMVGGKGGSVESVGLRTVKLRDLNGTLHVISNSSIDTLSNFSKVFSRCVMDIGIAYREDVDEVIEVLKELGEILQKDPEHGPNILEPLEIFGLDRFEDSAVIIRARFKTKPLKQWGIKRAFYRLMKQTFDERGIEIPFPHRTVYMGEPKDGSAPPLHVDIQPTSAKPEGP